MEIMNNLTKFIKKTIDENAVTRADMGGVLTEPLTKRITMTTFVKCPVVGLMKYLPVMTGRYPYRRVEKMPGAVGSVGANAASPVRAPKYSGDLYANSCEIRRRVQVPDRLNREAGLFGSSEGVTGFVFSDRVLEDNIQAHAYDVTAAVMYGNNPANEYDTTGHANNLIGSSRINYAKTGDGTPDVPTSVDPLSEAVARLHDNSDNPTDAWIFMSYRLATLFTRLDAAANGKRVNFGEGWKTVGGLMMTEFDGIPIIISDCFGGVKAGAMGTITPSTAATGGTIPDGTHYLTMTAVSVHGESLAAPEASQITAGGNASTITLDFADFETRAEFGHQAHYYRFYAGTATGWHNLKLIREVPANIYDADGNITGRRTSYTLDSLVADATVAGRENDTPPVLSAGGRPAESFMLLDLNPDGQGLGRGFVNTEKLGAGPAGFTVVKQLAETDAFNNVLLMTALGLIPDWTESSTYYRNLATA